MTTTSRSGRVARLRWWLVLAFALPVGVACSDGAPAVVVARDALNASCTHPFRFVVVAADGTCTAVQTTRGLWVSSPLFADAPVDAGACIYRWSGDPHMSVPSADDRAALEAHAGVGSVVTASCDPELDVSATATVTSIERLDVHPTIGSPGCDVCGKVLEARIWIVLPPATFVAHQFAVPLSDGSTRAFEIHVEDGARALSVALPPLPRGLTYLDGHVTVF